MDSLSLIVLPTGRGAPACPTLSLELGKTCPPNLLQSVLRMTLNLLAILGHVPPLNLRLTSSVYHRAPIGLRTKMRQVWVESQVRRNQHQRENFTHLWLCGQV